jgi:hypothetical protein
VRKRETTDTKKLLLLRIFSPESGISNAGACGWLELEKVRQQGNVDDFPRRRYARAMHHAHLADEESGTTVQYNHRVTLLFSLFKEIIQER